MRSQSDFHGWTSSVISCKGGFPRTPLQFEPSQESQKTQSQYREAAPQMPAAASRKGHFSKTKLYWLEVSRIVTKFDGRVGESLASFLRGGMCPSLNLSPDTRRHAVRKLKITMAIVGAILAVEGILDVAFPIPRAAGMGLGHCARQAQLPVIVLGVTWFAVGVWIIVTARDPLRHRSWVKFTLTLPFALMFALVLAAWRGIVAVREIALELALNALFAALLIAFAPRGQARPNSEPSPTQR
jgi:hypothetical protein